MIVMNKKDDTLNPKLVPFFLAKEEQDNTSFSAKMTYLPLPKHDPF